MASGQSLISECITHYDSSDPNGASNTRRRARLANILRRGYLWLWMFQEWEFQEVEATYTLAAGSNSVALATAAPNFMGFGRNGLLYNDTLNCPMKEKSRLFVRRLRRAAASLGAQHYRNFAIWEKKFQFVAAMPSATDYTISYRRTPDIAANADSATVLTVPDEYCSTVLLPYMMMWNQELKNDMRKDWQDGFVQGLSEMMVVQAPTQTMNRRMIPLAMRGVW